MIAAAEKARDISHALVGIVAEQAHSDVTSLCDLFGSALAGEGFGGEVEVLGDRL